MATWIVTPNARTLRHRLANCEQSFFRFVHFDAALGLAFAFCALGFDQFGQLNVGGAAFQPQFSTAAAFPLGIYGCVATFQSCWLVV